MKRLLFTVAIVIFVAILFSSCESKSLKRQRLETAKMEKIDSIKNDKINRSLKELDEAIIVLKNGPREDKDFNKGLNCLLQSQNKLKKGEVEGVVASLKEGRVHLEASFKKSSSVYLANSVGKIISARYLIETL